jgi:5-formyltetrahydrofolate cyclo-ligase
MTDSLKNAKTGLRQQIRVRLGGMTPTGRAAGSQEMCSRLRRQGILKSAGAILFFAPMPAEPDIWPLFEEALLAGKIAALPRFSPQSQSYVACVVQDARTELQSGKLGIREPGVSCPEIALNRLDLVLVPGVAFDARGGRLGRGKGYYDRLLSAVRGTKCGVAFDEQIVDAVPVGPKDVCLNCILTPTRWIET